MSTTVTEYRAPEPVPSAAHALIEWAQAGSAASELAARLVQTPFIPAHFAGKAGEATAAIIFGAEVGLSPLQALQSIYVIGGKPAMYAKTLMAVALSQGHEVWTEELTDSRAIVCGRRRGSSQVERTVWTLDRAKRAGYTRNAKYGTDPQAMLLARGQSDICRRIAADALLGMPYAVEELEDEPPVNGSGPQTTTERKRTAQRAPVEVPEPPLDDPPTDPPAEPSQESPDAVTSSQLKKIGAAMTSLDMKDRTEALAFVSGVVGREITTRNDLTKDEASRVIDRLERLESAAEDKASAAEGAEPELTGWQS